MTTDASSLADNYLSRLEKEARILPPDQAAELVEDIREHIHAATSDAASEAQIREVLDRLGLPRAVVAEALIDTQQAPSTRSTSLLRSLPKRIWLVIGVVVVIAVAAFAIALATNGSTAPSGQPSHIAAQHLNARQRMVAAMVAFADGEGNKSRSSDIHVYSTQQPNGGTCPNGTAYATVSRDLLSTSQLAREMVAKFLALGFDKFTDCPNADLYVNNYATDADSPTVGSVEIRNPGGVTVEIVSPNSDSAVLFTTTFLDK